MPTKQDRMNKNREVLRRRPSSGPVRGTLQNTGIGALSLLLADKIAATPDEQLLWTTVFMAFFNFAFKLAKNFLFNRVGFNVVKKALGLSIVVPLCVFLVGCAGIKGGDPITITTYDSKTGNKRAELAFSQGFYGRGCAAFTFSPSGAVDSMVSQDASSDYVGVRVLPAIAADVVAAAVSFVPNVNQLVLEGILGREPRAMQPPAKEQGCDVLFSVVDEPSLSVETLQDTIESLLP